MFPDIFEAATMGSRKSKRDGRALGQTHQEHRPDQVAFLVRPVYQHLATTQPFPLSAVRCSTLEKFLEAVHEAVPVTAVDTLFHKPVTTRVLVLQETGWGAWGKRRWTTISAEDTSAFESWYKRNLTNSPKKELKDLKVEMHILADITSGQNEEHKEWQDTTKEAGNGGDVGADLRKGYRLITKSRMTIPGIRQFENIPVGEIEKMAIVDFGIATEYQEAASTNRWFARRSQARRGTRRRTIGVQRSVVGGSVTFE